MSADIRMLDLHGRTLGLFGVLDRETCLGASEAILRLNSLPSKRPLHLYLGCSGGEAEDVLMVLDCLQSQRGRLHTYAMAAIRGMGLLLLSAGNKRCALPHANISTDCLDRPRGIGFDAVATRSANDGDSAVQNYLRGKLGTPAVKILLMNPTISLEAAVEIGLVHEIINTKKPSRERTRKKEGRAI